MSTTISGEQALAVKDNHVVGTIDERGLFFVDAVDRAQSVAARRKDDMAAANPRPARRGSLPPPARPVRRQICHSMARGPRHRRAIVLASPPKRRNPFEEPLRRRPAPAVLHLDRHLRSVADGADGRPQVDR